MELHKKLERIIKVRELRETTIQTQMQEAVSRHQTREQECAEVQQQILDLKTRRRTQPRGTISDQSTGMSVTDATNMMNTAEDYSQEVQRLSKTLRAKQRELRGTSKSQETMHRLLDNAVKRRRKLEKMRDHSLKKARELEDFKEDEGMDEIAALLHFLRYRARR
ncbi:MAG: hypothetical protein WED00_13485 [Aquisalimonadaceae bacterium]